jgi:hypothetical protein
MCDIVSLAILCLLIVCYYVCPKVFYLFIRIVKTFTLQPKLVPPELVEKYKDL